MENVKSKSALILRGVAMGIAEVIPGVSGGTIAFITGIYETLIDSIKSFGPSTITTLKNKGFNGFWKSINGDFLLWLLIGMAGGFVAGVFGVTYLMDTYPQPLWAFFFGLILASAWYMSKQITKWDTKSVVVLVLGIIIAYGITSLSPAEGSLNPFYVFIAGTIAISALMLPGISGSFILLIMGMYTIIVPLIRDTLENPEISNLITLGVFGLGCLTGLTGFSRVLSWLFKNYRNLTMSLLTGFLIGALNKVWPWRNVTSILDKESGNIEQVSGTDYLLKFDPEQLKILSEQNVLPADFSGSPMTILSILCMFLGAFLVLILERLEEK